MTTNQKLQELIDTLKRQGVESGEEASRAIVANAQKEAGNIVAQAKSEAESIVAKAKESADSQMRQLHSSMEIAAAELITDLKRAIEDRLISMPLRRDLDKSLSDTGFLKELIATCVREYMKNPGRSDLDVIVSKEQKERLGDFAGELIRSVSTKREDGGLSVNLQSGDVSFGFIVGKSDSAVRLDFTADAFLELFLRYLSPRFREFFKAIDVKALGRK
jgi:V/A-type H+/Na+-transporting ATPase subunit E